MSLKVSNRSLYTAQKLADAILYQNLQTKLHKMAAPSRMMSLLTRRQISLQPVLMQVSAP